MGIRWIMKGTWTALPAAVLILAMAGCASSGLAKNGAVTYGKEAYGGRVLDDASEAPIAGAELIVYVDVLTEHSSPRHIIGSVSTDSGGRFLIPATPITIQINASTLSMSPYPLLRLSRSGYQDLTMELKRGDRELELRMKPRRTK